MAVNKNFVVKNGLEVNTDLIFADASTSKVGIGSTIPTNELDIIGGIGATNIHLTGVGTIPTIKGTTGIVSTVVAHNVQVNNINITGLTTLSSLGTLSELYVSGVSTAGTLDVIGTGNMRVGIITEAQGTNLNFAGISTLGVTTTTDLTAQKFNVSGISTINNLIITPDDVGTGSTIGAAVGVITYIGDGSQLTGVGIGIGSTGSDGLGASGLVGYGFTQLNFIGLGVSDVLFNTSVGIATIWIAGGGGGSGNVSIGSEAPSSPSSGDLWYSTEYGTTFIWFDEVALGIGNTAVWVDSAPFNQGGKFLGKYGDTAYGAIGYTGGTTSQASIYFTGDPNTGLIQPAADHVNIVAGGTKSLEVNPSGISIVGVITGTGSGLTGVAATDNIITTTEAKLLGGVRMEGFTTSSSMNVTGISTFRNDITITGSQAGVTSVFWDASADTLTFQDLSYAKFGAGGDLSIYHDGSHSRIDETGTGDLKLQTNNAVWIQKGASESIAGFNVDGAIELYHDNGKTFETTANGVTIYDDGKDDEARLIVQGGEGNAATLYLYADDGDDNADKWRVYSTASGTFGIESYSTGSWVSGLSFDGSVNATFGGSVLVGSAVTLNNTGIDMGIGAGIVTAYQFYGDGSNLTGIAAGGSGQFNTSISGATQYDVTASMATAYTANASSSIRTVVHSIHICNISASEVSVSGEMQTSFSFAHTIPVPAGSAVELLKQPKVLGPSETIELQASSGSALEATIIVEEKEDTALWDAQLALSSSATMTDLYTSATYPSVVQSILLCNNDGSNDVKARVVWTDGGDSIQSYLVYDMVIPADSTVEICEQPKYLAAGYKLRAYASQADRLEITASGSQIVS